MKHLLGKHAGRVPSYMSFLLVLLVGLAGLPVAYVAPLSGQRAEGTSGTITTNATSYTSMSGWTSSIPIPTTDSLVPLTRTSNAQTIMLATTSSTSNLTAKVRLIVHKTSASVKAQAALQGCEIVRELINATAMACPANIKVPNSEPDAILHILDLQSDRQIRADEVWALGYTGSGVTVAVLDTGVDVTHPELTSSIVGGRSFVYYTQSYADDHGHGTHVSGIITSDGIDANSKGAAYNAQVWMAKVCDASGNCLTSDMVAAIQYVVTNHIAKVMSISIGGGGTTDSNCDSDYLASQINWAYNNRVVSVIAAGNNDPKGIVNSPACASKAIAVAAVDSSDNLASFSDYGNALRDHGVAAPGASIYSTVPGGSYASWSGTSMATPHVSATIALMLQKNPNLALSAIKSIIFNSANCLGGKYGSCPNTYIGYGRVDASNAVLNVLSVATDKIIYAQLESVLFTGTGFTPGGLISSCISTGNVAGVGLCVGQPNADSGGNVGGSMLIGTNIPSGPQKFWVADISTGRDSNAVQLTITSVTTVTVTATVTSTEKSTSYFYRTNTTTVTSYTSTTRSTSTIPTVTTVVLVPLTVTSIVQSIQYLTSILSTTVTSYTDTQASTSTIVVPTTVVLVPSTVTTTAQSTQFLTSTSATTVTNYTSTETSTSTILVPTTVVLVPLTATSTDQSVQYLSSTATTTVTSYTDTQVATSTIPTVTTVVLLPSTATSTVESTQYLTSTSTTTVTNYTNTSTSTSTSVVYTTVTVSQGGAGADASSPLAYLGFISLLAITAGHKVTAGRSWRPPRSSSGEHHQGYLRDKRTGRPSRIPMDLTKRHCEATDSLVGF